MRDRTWPFRTLLLRSSILFCPFLLMALANLCSRRNRHLCSQYRCRVPLATRNEVGEEVVLEGQIMQRQDMDSFRSRSCISRAGRYPSRLAALSIQCVGRSAVSVSSGHRQSTTMASFTLFLLLAFPLLLLLLSPSRQALRRASFLLARTLRRWHSSHSSFLHVSTL